MHTLFYLWPDTNGQMSVRIASWEILHLEPALDEIRIRTRDDTFDVIIGFAYLTSFVYIPHRNICFPIRDLLDVDYSKSQLSGRLSDENAEAVATALKAYVS